MQESLLSVGQKLHIISRKRFREDVCPHFAGTVRSASGPLFSAHGYRFVFDSGTNSYIKHDEACTRYFSISDSGYIVTEIPQEVDLEALVYRTVSGRLAITDERGFSLQINEFGQSN